MANVIGVRFQNGGKICYYDPGELDPAVGDYIIADTERGSDLGEVVTKMQDLDENTAFTTCGPISRIATSQDMAHAQANRQAEQNAYVICQRKIQDHRLDMKLVSVEYTFDNSKIMFYFTSNGRVDFRSLVKDLAGVFKTRIELRQIGVRDEAKMLGGLGPCGRPICCGAFLKDFQPVSIKMAKEQNLSLNPTKISGVCGRLMCCLKYEQDNYETIRKMMPKVGREVNTPDGVAVVTELNIIKETVQVRITKGDASELKEFRLDEISKAGEPVITREDSEILEETRKEETVPVVDVADFSDQDDLSGEKQKNDDDQAVFSDAQSEATEQITEEARPEPENVNRRSPRNGQRPRNPVKRENEKKPERSERKPHHSDEQLGKPVQRENPNRKPVHNRSEQKSRNNQRRPGERRENRQAPQTGTAPIQNEKNTPSVKQPAVPAAKTVSFGRNGTSQWQAALQRAMEAAGQNTQKTE